jgi:hypothetical protein
MTYYLLHLCWHTQGERDADRHAGRGTPEASSIWDWQAGAQRPYFPLRLCHPGLQRLPAGAVPAGGGLSQGVCYRGWCLQWMCCIGWWRFRGCATKGGGSVDVLQRVFPAGAESAGGGPQRMCCRGWFHPT